MRAHQNLLRSLCTSHLLKTEEADKDAFMYTIAIDDLAREKIREHYRIFIRQVEKIVAHCKPQHAYQLNYELFKWV